MICRNCGRVSPDDAVFCSTCGARLVQENNQNCNNQGHNYDPNYNPNGNFNYNPNYNPNCNPNYNPNSDPNYNPYYNFDQNTLNAQPVKQPGKGLAIASMVLGIVSLLLFITFRFAIFSILLSILAIVFGAVAKGKKCKSGMAVAGIVCGSVVLALLIAKIVFSYIIALRLF